MAQVAVMGVMDIALGLAGIGMMIPSMLPEKPEDSSHHTNVRIGVGIWGNEEDVKKSSMSGKFPDVRLFDQRGTYIGRNKGNFPHIDAGGFKDVSISHVERTNGRQAEYIAISSSSDDAICINYVSMTWPDGQSLGMLGDVGRMCGAHWYYSDVKVANFDSDSSEAPMDRNRTSNCIWIDKDGTNGLNHQGLAFHIVDFSSSKDTENDGRAKQYAEDPDSMCKSEARFKMYEKMDKNTKIKYFDPPLTYKTDNSDSDVGKVKNKDNWKEVGQALTNKRELQEYDGEEGHYGGIDVEPDYDAPLLDNNNKVEDNKYDDDRDDDNEGEGYSEDEQDQFYGEEELVSEPTGQPKTSGRPTPTSQPKPTGYQKSTDRPEPTGYGKPKGRPGKLDPHMGRGSTIIKTSRPEHCAKTLCGDKLTAGPDLVNTRQGIYCDMAKKNTWPVCSNKRRHACFDNKTNNLRPAQYGRRSINGREIPNKAYKHEVTWGQS